MPYRPGCPETPPTADVAPPDEPAAAVDATTYELLAIRYKDMPVHFEIVDMVFRSLVKRIAKGHDGTQGGGGRVGATDHDPRSRPRRPPGTGEAE